MKFYHTLILPEMLSNLPWQYAKVLSCKGSRFWFDGKQIRASSCCPFRKVFFSLISGQDEKEDGYYYPT